MVKQTEYVSSRRNFLKQLGVVGGAVAVGGVSTLISAGNAYAGSQGDKFGFNVENGDLVKINTTWGGKQWHNKLNDYFQFASNLKSSKPMMYDAIKDAIGVSDGIFEIDLAKLRECNLDGSKYVTVNELISAKPGAFENLSIGNLERELTNSVKSGGGNGGDGGGSGGGSSGGGTCFVAGTQITMSDGSFKNIEDVKAGEEVLTYNEEKEENESQKVLETKSHLSNHYYNVEFEDGTVLKVTENHPLLSRNGWSAINVEAALNDKGVECQDLVIGDEILSSNGSYRKIVSMDRIDGEIVVYDLSKVAVTHTFFVEGLVAHNKGGSGGF